MFTEARILVVDDDPDIRTLIRMTLTKNGYRYIDEVDSGQAAIKKIETGRFDLVLLDWWMAGMNGFQVLKEVRKWHADLPFIMVTSLAERDKVVEAVKAGANDYIVKPFTQKVLLMKIEGVLAMSKFGRDKSSV